MDFSQLPLRSIRASAASTSHTRSSHASPATPLLSASIASSSSPCCGSNGDSIVEKCILGSSGSQPNEHRPSSSSSIIDRG